MLRISNIPLSVDEDITQLKAKAARILGIGLDAIQEFSLLRQSIDARKKSDVHYVCTVQVSADQEEALAQKCGGSVTLFAPTQYAFPPVRRTSSLPPVVVGMGPAGLFSALSLARAGIPCIILERGQDVDTRAADVEQFWNTGALNVSSNVQFGEGGAGTFSDGKLNTGTNDERISFVFDTFVKNGAPADILYQHRPHIGTDLLRSIVKSMRQELLRLGCDIRFGHTLTGLDAPQDALRGITVTAEGASYSIPCDALILAPGHSARDTFSMLLEAGLPMEQKPFAIGVRIEHSQASLSSTQYGPLWEQLPPADYKLSCHLPNGRSAFSFCVCPGGQVVAAASEPGRVVTNGMSLRSRAGTNCNGGFLVGVTPADFGGNHPLQGMEFQAIWEEKAFRLGGGNFCAPCQTVRDFWAGKASHTIAAVAPTYRPGVVPSNLRLCLPDYVTDTLAGALPLFARKLPGFSDPNALLTGVETRSSSPVRILRDEGFESAVRGVYPCGEGAGYAGGITSAAVDGIKVAEAVAAKN